MNIKIDLKLDKTFIFALVPLVIVFIMLLSNIIVYLNATELKMPVEFYDPYDVAYGRYLNLTLADNDIVMTNNLLGASAGGIAGGDMVANTTDDSILTLIECNNEELKQENSNKNPTVNSVQRDYMAGEVSKDITNRILLPEEIVEAHSQGIIHFHDSDYFAQHMHNCDLVNLEDMLQNGTVISGTMIEKPHSFSTACNIATQIIAQVASNQYGGQSISLTHLAPFVQISREKIRKIVDKEMEDIGVELSEEKTTELVEKRLRDEIERGVQTIQYQVVTLLTTNGQAPFVTVFMYLNEAKDPQLKKDLEKEENNK